MPDPGGYVHDENPFADPAGRRDPVRRFRGRVASAVTLWTAGGPERRAGLTVSPVLVAEGEPPCLFGLVGDLSELWEAIRDTGLFVVHVLEVGHRDLAERFAGLRPSPGGVFAGLAVGESAWGPVLAGVATRARCRLRESSPAGYRLLVTGTIEEIEVGEVEAPLVHFRGRYLPTLPRDQT